MTDNYLFDPIIWLETTAPFSAFCVRLLLVREGSPKSYPVFTSSRAVYEMFAPLGDLDREVFFSVMLDIKQRLTGMSLVSVGTLDASIVHPREVFKAAVVGNAAAILCVHNHPSGDPTPSREDLALSTRLARAGKVLGIPVLDHVVIGVGGYTSFKDQGLL